MLLSINFADSDANRFDNVGLIDSSAIFFEMRVVYVLADVFSFLDSWTMHSAICFTSGLSSSVSSAAFNICGKCPLKTRRLAYPFPDNLTSSGATRFVTHTTSWRRDTRLLIIHFNTPTVIPTDAEWITGEFSKICYDYPSKTNMRHILVDKKTHGGDTAMAIFCM